MKFYKKVNKEFDAKYLSVIAGVRYWEDAKVNGEQDEDGNLIPCRMGENWCPLIELETGVIANWVKGTEADIHYKVCDAGEYLLLDNDSKVIATIDGYVINMLSVGENGYGDYIIMKVDSEGKIEGWEPNLEEFTELD